MAILSINQMPILTLLSWMTQKLELGLQRWTRAVGVGPVPEHLAAVPAGGEAMVRQLSAKRTSGPVARLTLAAATMSPDRDKVVPIRGLERGATLVSPGDASGPRRARTDPFIAGQGARIYSLDAFRRAHFDRRSSSPHVA